MTKRIILLTLAILLIVAFAVGLVIGWHFGKSTNMLDITGIIA